MTPRTTTPPHPSTPDLSVILLTKDEALNVEDAVRSLLDQEDVDLEVLVVDSASADDTVPLAQRLADADPRVRVLPSARNLTVGEARNAGLESARGGIIAFMSADATAAPGWGKAAVDALADADIAYGRQTHTPPALTVAAVVRGLRYHHFDHDDGLPPDAFASNVNAAVRRHVFTRLRYVDDGPASALDDILFTAEARDLGFRVAYRRDMLVRHKDAATLRQELVKNRREGRGWGLLAPRLGMHRSLLAWGVAVPVVAGVAIAVPTPVSMGALVLAAYAPALRRILRAGGRYVARAPHTLTGALLVSPVFDIAFLISYLGGLRERRSDLTGITRPQGA